MTCKTLINFAKGASIFASLMIAFSPSSAFFK